MPYRTVSLVNESFYHIFNRGVEKRTIFTDDRDKNRFLKTLSYYQYLGPKPRLSIFNPLIHKELKTDKIIEIVAFCLMPNHFHLLLKQNHDKGISEFLSKLSNSYSKYFNTKHKRVGPLFQGEFKAVLVESDEQLLHLSRYVHLNPFVSGLVTNLRDYPWSSYLEYLHADPKRPGGVGSVLEFFKSPDEYERFVLDHQDYAQSLELIKHQILEDE